MFGSLKEAERHSLQSKVRKVSFTNNSLICEKHVSSYFEFFQPRKQKSRQICLNPFNEHSDDVVGLSTPSKGMTSSTTLKKLELTKDVLLCKNCYSKCNKILNGQCPMPEVAESTESSAGFVEELMSGYASDSDLQSSEEVFMGSQPSTSREVLNSCLRILGLKDIELKNKHQRERYAQQVVQDVCTVVDSKLRQVLELPALPTCSEHEFPSSDFEELMLGIRSKFRVATKTEKLQMLTLKPSSWSTAKTASFFEVSENFVKRAKRLKNTSGLLSSPPKINARKLSVEIIASIKEFFEDDEISRVLPGMKEKIGGHQKRLILGNLSEIFSEFRKAYPTVEVGKTSFASHRPKWCVWPGSSGTHSVCVCVKHQNFKLLCTAAQLPKDCYKDCIASSMCLEPSENCYLNKCDQCPNLDGVCQKLDDFLFFCFADQAEEQENVDILQWESVDRGELKTQTLTKSKLRDVIAQNTLALREHHYVANEQARYFKTKKENLQENQAVIVMDFSENFAFSLQESSQASYFNQKQATVLVAVAYTRSPEPNMPPIPHSFIFLSDFLEHTTGVVRCFQKKLILEIVTRYPQVTQALWFSDGARQHFKNLKAFRELVEHKEELLGLDGESSFFATAHGKGSCDGVGGAFKLSAHRHNLKIRPNETPIRNAEEMSVWAQNQTESKVEKVFFVPKSELVAFCRKFETKHKSTKRFDGSSKCHHFVPGAGGTTIKGFRTSFSTDFVEQDIMK